MFENFKIGHCFTRNWMCMDEGRREKKIFEMSDIPRTKIVLYWCLSIFPWFIFSLYSLSEDSASFLIPW